MFWLPKVVYFFDSLKQCYLSMTNVAMKKFSLHMLVLELFDEDIQARFFLF